MRKRELSDAEHEQRVEAAKARWSDRFPRETGTLVGAAAIVGLGVGSDAINLVRGHPGAPRKSLLDRLSDAGATVTAKVKAGAVPTKKSLDRETIDKWKMSGSARINGSQGIGSAKTRFLMGYFGGSNGLQARIHDLTRRRVDVGGQTKLWRGEVGMKAMLRAKPGDVITRHQPTAWSSNSKIATSFAKHNTKGNGHESKNKGITKPALRTRTVIRNAKEIQNVANIDAQGGLLSSEKESVIGHGAKLRIDKVRDSKAGRVIFATALAHSPEASFRLSMLRRFMSPSYQAGRAGRGLVISGLSIGPLAYLTHGSIWGTAVPKEQA